MMGEGQTKLAPPAALLEQPTLQAVLFALRHFPLESLRARFFLVKSNFKFANGAQPYIESAYSPECRSPLKLQGCLALVGCIVSASVGVDSSATKRNVPKEGSSYQRKAYTTENA